MTIDPLIIALIKDDLNVVNPYVKQYRVASNVIHNSGHPPVKLFSIGSQNSDGRIYNTPTTSELAALIVGDIDVNFNVRDIIIHEHSGDPHRINELHPSYLPLQYPLLFPYGEDGYRDDVLYRAESLGCTKLKKLVSVKEFFCYRLVDRKHETSIICILQGFSNSLMLMHGQ